MSPPGGPRFPAVARVVLETTLAEGPRRDALLGDLEELWAERRRRQGRLGAAAWLAWQVSTVAWMFVVMGRIRRQAGHDPEASERRGSEALTVTLRRLGRAPAFSLAVVATLALGVGATTAMFSLVSGVLLEPLPYPAPDRIVFVHEDNDGIDMPPGWSTAANYLDWREQSASFESLALFRGRSVSITTDAIPEYAYGALVTPEFFEVFGVEPVLGRTIAPEESAPGGSAVVVLGHGLWTRGFGADAELVGRTVRVDGEPHTVVGVMPRGFQAHGDWVGLPVQVWRPFVVTDESLGQGRSYHVAGRLAEGTGLEAARREMAVLTERLARVRPEENADWYVRLDSYRDMIVGDVAPALWLLLSATGLILLIAAANVANLALNRVLDRRSELAARRALGATRRSIVGLVLRESAILGAAGGALGLGLAQALLVLARALEAGRIPRLDTVALDGRVLLFSLGVVTLSALGFGTVAAFSAVRSAPASVLRAASSGGIAGARLRSALVGTQLVLSFALVLAAGLLARSFESLRTADLGFEAEGVAAATVALSWSRVGTIQERALFSGEVLRALRALPAVESAGMINSLPLSGSDATQQVEIAGVSEAVRDPAVAIRGISPGYLETLRIPLEAGRAFDEADVANPRAVLVNRAMATRYWPGLDPIGSRLRLSGEDEWRTVVGVVGDVRHYGPERPARPELYVPYSDEYLTSKTFVVRWRNTEAAGEEGLREAIAGVDGDQPVREVRSMETWVANATAGPRFQTATALLAAALATALAAVGLFGVLAANVRARIRELAMRAALGAPRSAVVCLVVRRAATLLGSGLVGGTVLALLLGDVLQRFLVGVSPHDGSVILGAALIFTAVGAGATLLPVRRATSLDPARVLRDE